MGSRAGSTPGCPELSCGRRTGPNVWAFYNDECFVFQVWCRRQDAHAIGWRELGRYNVAMAPVIRDYKPEDFEWLWRMDQQCFPPGISYSKQELRAFVRGRGSFTLVAVNDKEEIQGFIVAHCRGSGHIITIDVAPGSRGSGVGSLLLRTAEDRMRAAGCWAVGLEAAVDNATALAFYKRHGYSVIRTWPRYYSNGVDALVLKKNLN